MTTESITQLIATLNRLPVRTPIVLRSDSGIASRRSKGRDDKAKVGAPTNTAGAGFGVIAKDLGKALDFRGEWVVNMAVRPPQTDAERLVVARAMVARWMEQSEYLMAHGPDDERDREAHEAKRLLRAQIAREASALVK